MEKRCGWVSCGSNELEATYRSESLEKKKCKHRGQIESKNRGDSGTEQVEVGITYGDKWTYDSVSLQCGEP